MNRAVALTAVGVLCLTMASCGEEEGAGGLSRVTLQLREDAEVAADRVEAAYVPPQVHHVWVRIYAHAAATEREVVFVDSTTVVTEAMRLAGYIEMAFFVPDGPDRHIEVKAFDAEDEVVSEGSAYHLSLPLRDGLPVIIVMSPLEGPSFGGLEALEVLGESSVLLSWVAATDAETPQSEIVYLVYQATTPGGQDFQSPTHITSPGATSYEVGNLSEGTYFFVVRARDQDGNRDTNRVERSVTLGQDTLPPVFEGLAVASALQNGSVLLSWSPATDNQSPSGAIVYEVFESLSPGLQDFGAPTYSTAPGETSIEIGDLQAGLTYFFVVRARDEAGNTDTNTVERSVTVSEVAQDTTPPVFGGVEEAVEIDGVAFLSWTAATDDVTAQEDIVYDVYVSSDGPPQDFGIPYARSGPGETSVVLEDLAFEVMYWFIVRARDEAGNADENIQSASLMLLGP